MPSEQKVTRKLAAILHADVKGYCLLMADDEIATLKTLHAYLSIFSDYIQKHRGRVVGTEGDAILADFASVVDAVQCAVEVQEILNAKNSELPQNRRLQFRIGINLGDVIEKDGDIYGDGVNIAARIEGLADPGGVCLSRSAYDQIKKKLRFGFKYLGEHHVKNISEPIKTYKVLMDCESHLPLEHESVELPDKPSIAVLPFTNMSYDSSQEYFSDGLTEQIINGLCKVSNLFVIARNSSFAYKGKAVNVKQIAKELGVRYILEGSVQKANSRVRITAQLIDATSGFHMWSDTYDRELEDIFAFQDEITLKIIEAMHVNLTFGEQARLWKGSTLNIQALDKHMRGADYIFRYNEKNNKQAQGFFREAISIDTEYASAYVFLGYTHMLDLLYGWSKSPKNSFEKAKKNVEKAISLNASLDMSHTLLGWIYLFERQHEKAIKEAELAIELNPNGAEAHAHYGFILLCSDMTELSIKILKRALRLNPIPPPHYYIFLAMAYRIIGQYDKAIELSHKCLIDNANQLAQYLTLAASYCAVNRIEEAKLAVKEVLSISPSFSVEYYGRMLPYKNQATLDDYIKALRKAGLPD